MTVEVIKSKYTDKPLEMANLTIPNKVRTGLVVEFKDLDNHENIERAEQLVHVITAMINQKETLTVNFKYEKKPKFSFKRKKNK